MLRTAVIKNRAMRGARLLIGENADRLKLTRNYHYYRRHGIIFVHIPKCAGSSVSKALYGCSLGHLTADQLRRHDVKNFDRLKSFAVIRDPLARARSAWAYCCSEGTKEGWVQPREEYKHPHFRDFNSFAMKWLPNQNFSELDLVFQPQVDFISDRSGNILVDELVTLDNLSDKFASIISDTCVSSHKLVRKNKNKNNIYQPISQDSKDAIECFYKSDYTLYRTHLV